MADALNLSATAHEENLSLRSLTRATLSSLQTIRTRLLDDADLRAPTIVFAPHQDDETLGCGGTLVRKCAMGSPVSVVFMTDGSASHPQFMAAEKLAATRAGEALAATLTLGVAERQVRFLGAPDGALRDQGRTVIPALIDILTERRPAQVFIPYARDRLPDHVATHDFVVTAIRRAGLSVTIFEYPVWFWNHWPWMRQSTGTTTERLRHFARESLAGLMDFNTRVCVRDVLEKKIAALNCHKTQMTRFDASEQWLTLNDVAGGDFIRCLLGDREIFHRWQIR